ncbi:Transcription antiterminator LicT [Brachyspira suanatina]|uniref:Transcription antiterminator LicT n=1 Tax=Brachyspira suanatina TaxID=381802 RepID=A0A0G4KAG0_9SPIR|nr:PRD domain-containing protein [Brachyspira suanatina]CRF35553.1 Transcription antiterminator LicT [Brachyspira suanatina]
MKVAKILNNNVVVVFENGKTEKIVMGRGIAFGKKVGDIIDEEKIDKTFLLENSDNNSKLQQLLKDIPTEYLNTTEKIIKYAKTKAERSLNDFLYITLMDHIYMAVSRTKDGINIKNMMLWDIKKFYKDEYNIGLKALDIIEEDFNVKLSEDEAGFIALHIINAQIDGDGLIDEIEKATNLIYEITKIVKNHFNTEFDEDSLYYNRFLTHLKFFSLRLFSKKLYDTKNDGDLLSILKDKYHESYECTLKIVKYILDLYSYSLSEEEQAYLTIHIEKVSRKE